MHVETSYALYKGEYKDNQAIYRYVDELTPEKRKQRNQALHKAFHPNSFRYVVRLARNFTNTATDSLTEAFGLVAGKAKAGQQLLAPGQTHLKGLTKDLLGYVGTNYDPLLEKFVGVQVVAEGSVTGAVAATAGTANREISATVEGRVLTVQNRTPAPVLLSSIKVGQDSRMVNAVIEKGSVLHYTLADTPERVELTLKIVREVDMIMPRAHALIRHRAERYQPSDAFNIPVVMNLTAEHEDEERRERERLESNPDDAEAALNLGLVLLRRNEVAEAAHWLGHALEMRDQLPDGGLLASHQLQRLLCRQQQFSED